jgi:dTDP-4-amino-4,6-dideoxygalactose transaminase
LAAATAARRRLAARYRTALAAAPVTVPPECDPGHVYHLFPVLTGERDRFQAHLREHGIETLVHYPVPIPRQPAARSWTPAECPVADAVCARVVSLPLYPSLADSAQDDVARAVLAFER